MKNRPFSLLTLLLLCVMPIYGLSQETQKEKQSIGNKIQQRLSFQVEGSLNFYKGGYQGFPNVPTPNMSIRLVGFERSSLGAGYAIGLYGDILRYNFFTLSSGIVFCAGSKTHTAVRDSVALYNPYSPYSKFVDWKYDIQLPIWLKFMVTKNLELGIRTGIPLYSFGSYSSPESSSSIEYTSGHTFEIDELSNEISVGYNLRIQNSKVMLTPIILFGGRFVHSIPPMNLTIGVRICIE